MRKLDYLLALGDRWAVANVNTGEKFFVLTLNLWPCQSYILGGSTNAALYSDIDIFRGDIGGDSGKGFSI